MNRHERRKQQSWARRDKRLQGMDVRYGGRTLVFDVLVNTDEDAEKVAWRTKLGAAGPKRVMALVGAEEPRLVDAAWSAAEIPTFFGGTTVILKVCVNTDEPAEAVSARILEAARIPGNPATEALLRTLNEVPDHEPVSLAVIVSGGDVEPEVARPLWEAAFRATEKTVEREN